MRSRIGHLARAVVQQRRGQRSGQRIGHRQIRGDHAAQRAACTGDFGHHRAAARQPVHGFAVGHQVGDAGHGHCTADGSIVRRMLGVLLGQIPGKCHRRTGCGIHVIDGFHSGGAVFGSVPHGFGVEPPHIRQRDHLGSVCTNHSRGSGLEGLKNRGAGTPDACGHRVEHPRLVQIIESLRDFRQRVLIERQQRAHIDVVGARDFRGFDHVVRQEAHGRSAAGCQLCVGHQIDGHEIGERLGQRRHLAYAAHGGCDVLANR